MHTYRTHTCGALRKSDEGKTVKLSGWISRIRDHGGVLFIDLRDTYGVTQCVIEEDSNALIDIFSKIRNESVVTITGKVVARAQDAINQKNGIQVKSR
ncbi:MAG: OB-fold nucleic acid binding domain-containing protein [Alphaproteobacteria bacterium]|nr:OB-fold nucleic acid binding domain-containing protein [Alphaproteobacteria bacterium]